MAGPRIPRTGVPGRRKARQILLQNANEQLRATEGMERTPPRAQGIHAPIHGGQEEEMTPLPEVFSHDKFDFQLIARENGIALLRKSKKDYEGYEVVVIQSMGDRTFPNGETVTAHEYIPRSEQWGKYGWSYQDSEGAWKKFKALVAK